MAGATFKVHTADLRGLRQDLESVQLGLGRELTRILREEARLIAAGAIANTPIGPGPTPGNPEPHMASTIASRATATGAAITSTHPGAGVLEYGGTIAPRGTPITIAQNAMAHRAADDQRAAFERRVGQRIDALLRRHGL